MSPISARSSAAESSAIPVIVVSPEPKGCRQHADLLSDPRDLPVQLAQASDTLPCYVGTNAVVAAEEPPGPVEVPFSGEPPDPRLVSRMELLKVRVQPACGSRALGLKLTAVMHENPQVLDVSGWADLRELQLSKGDSADKQGVDRVRLRMGALAPARLSR